MKVSYRLANATGAGANYTVLFDMSVPPSGVIAGQAILEDFSPDFQGTIQETPIAFSPKQFRAPRSNIKTTFELKFRIQYVSNAACFDATVSMNQALVDQLLHIKVEEVGSTQPQYYPNAVCQHMKFQRMGVSAEFTVPFASDNVTTVAP